MPIFSHKVDGRLLPLILILGLRVASKNVYIPNLAKRVKMDLQNVIRIGGGGETLGTQEVCKIRQMLSRVNSGMS